MFVVVALGFGGGPLGGGPPPLELAGGGGVGVGVLLGLFFVTLTRIAEKSSSSAQTFSGVVDVVVVNSFVYSGKASSCTSTSMSYKAGWTYFPVGANFSSVQHQRHTCCSAKDANLFGQSSGVLAGVSLSTCRLCAVAFLWLALLCRYCGPGLVSMQPRLSNISITWRNFALL